MKWSILDSALIVFAMFVAYSIGRASVLVDMPEKPTACQCQQPTP